MSGNLVQSRASPREDFICLSEHQRPVPETYGFCVPCKEAHLDCALAPAALDLFWGSIAPGVQHGCTQAASCRL